MTFWYAAILCASLLLISGGTFREIYEQMRSQHHPGGSERHALAETGEMVFQVGLPAIVLGLAGGWWLTRRALAPVAHIARAAELINEKNLSQPLPRSKNGDELDRLAEVLNAMNARLNDSFTRVREFTLHASHELKTPLTVMHGELETVLRETEHALPSAQRDLLLSQLDEIQRLSKIVDGLSLLARADAGQIRLHRERLQLDELVRDVHADTVILALPAHVTVEPAHCEPLAVSGDRHRLRQLLLNLADNAVKYNQPGGSVSMDLRRENGSAKLAIANTGPGIPAAMLGRVFDRFFRGDAAHGTEVEGCGLGLSIAQWIVSAHQGTIQVESQPSKLTTVTVRLPLLVEGGAA
jgi:signal transduction histidine kinase